MTKETFNKIASHPLQSWEWGEFRKRAGNELVRFPFGQITLHKIPFTPFKVAAFEKGPAPTSKMLEELKRLARKENLVFIKLEPNSAKASLGTAKFEQVINLLKKNGAVPGRRLFTPTTFWIDLTPSEEELLKSFHSKTRYNIRLAQKNGVEVKENNSDKAFEKYISLTRETAQRQKFYAHSEKYHRLMWTVLHKEMVKEGKAPIARLLTATYKKEIITTWILFVWHDFLYYPYGASTDKYKNVMANNLIMWEAIRLGQSLGLKTFDLWGREEGKGFTKFKEGYNPQVIEFLGTWDLITNPLYYPYRLSEYLRWIILRAKSKIIKPTF
ncbi:MAG: peptidoglycan bridge formation glycyltransferase FemA/FemB family protein [Patescibacteria group bacterium]